MGQFSSLGRSVDGMTVIERGEGCYVWDTEGKRYLDGLAGLYTTQAGYGQPSLAAAAGAQAETLAFFPIWTYAHPARPARRSPRVARPRRSQPCVLHQRWI